MTAREERPFRGVLITRCSVPGCYRTARVIECVIGYDARLCRPCCVEARKAWADALAQWDEAAA